MQVLVIRHAIAAEAAPGEDDGARPLTRKGIRRFRQGVRGLAAMEMKIGAVLTSPWRRAAATADLLAPLLTRGASCQVTDLLCQPPLPALLTALTAAGSQVSALRNASVAVVGHEPFLGELIGLLTSGVATVGESLQLKKGSVTVLHGSAVAGGMTLCALLPPRALRELGR